MRQAIINKDLIGDEPLYYTQTTDGWYFCKYFTLREEYCYIEEDSIVIEDNCRITEPDIIPDNYYSHFNITFETICSKKYAILDYFNITYKVPYKFYKNIISKIYCDVYADAYYIASLKQDCKLIFYDEDEIVGWLEPYTFEILNKEEYIEENTEFIPKEIENNIIFKDVTPFYKGISRVIYNNFCAKLDSKGNIIQKLNCEDCWFYDKYTAIKINRKWGAIDLSNNMIIPPKYDNLYYLENNFWKITINDKTGIIDTQSNIILPAIYDKLYTFNEHFIIAVKENLYGVIDYKGNTLIPFEYQCLEFCFKKQESQIYFYATKYNSVGIIDINNSIIIPFNYDVQELFYLSENTIVFKFGEDVYILINEETEQIVKFEEIHSNYDDTKIYPAKSNGLWGFIDDLGNTKIDFKYTDATEFSKGYCNVSINKNPDFFDDYGLINKEGTLILDYKYSKYCTFVIDNDRFIVEQDYKPFIIDRKGNVIVDKLYADISPRKTNGFLPVTLENGYKGFIDRNGKPLKINKKTLDTPIIPINYNYDNLSQIEKISILFDGKEL